MAAKTATKKALKIAKETSQKQAKKTTAPARTRASAEKRLSQIGAAARVLAQAQSPMNTREMVEAMTKKGLWSSPAGKTPEATLYAALLRHIRDKGKEAEFKKVGPGKFALAR